MKIKYNGKLHSLKITNGALNRFEEYGFSIHDFATPGRQFRAQFAMIRACLDPDAEQQDVADGVDSTFVENDAAIGAALVSSGIVPADEADLTSEETELGNESPDGESSEPSPRSNSGSRRKSLKRSK